MYRSHDELRMADLNTDNYIHVPNFIDPGRAVSLGQEFKEHTEKHNLPGDSQVKRSRAAYDYVSFLELLVEKTNHVTELCGENVLPTYCYARVYNKGADLKVHTDRPACEVSITLNLGSDVPWPIYIQKPDGESVPVTLGPGDAVLYLGCVASHWREEFTGDYCNQVFLHYVKSRGQNQPFYFDKTR